MCPSSHLCGAATGQKDKTSKQNNSDNIQFGRAFLEQWPLKCVNGTLYTLDGPVEDESEDVYKRQE